MSRSKTKAPLPLSGKDFAADIFFVSGDAEEESVASQERFEFVRATQDILRRTLGFFLEILSALLNGPWFAREVGWQLTRSE